MQDSLLNDIQSGDAAAFEEVFNEYYSSLCRYALKFVGDPDESEEIVQNSFVKFWNKKEQITISTSLKSYLYQAVKNESLNHIKHLKVVKLHEGSQQNKYESDGSDTLVAKELQNKIEDSLAKLPAERKKIFLMSRNEGLKYRGIADKLDISIKTVENQMGKALKFFRSELIEYLSIGLLVLFKYLNI